jgi:porin
VIRVQNNSAAQVCRVLVGLFAGMAVSAGAEAQGLGVQPVPANPDAPSSVPASIAPAAPSVNGVPEGDFFTFGQPLKPFGDALANNGVYLKGFWQSTLFSNPSGGVQRGTIGYDEAYFGADFDLQKMAGLTGSVIHFSIDSRFGGMPQGVNNFGGSDAGYLQGTGPDNQTRLNELTWDQHLFDDKIRFVVGRTSLADYFATSDLYCQFQIGTCGNIGPFTWSADSNSTFWPIATWAGEVAYFPTPEVYIRVGASESDPYQYTGGGFVWNGGWSTSHATGVFLPVEVGYQEDAATTRYAGRYDIGFTYDSSNFADERYNTQGGLLAYSGGTPMSDGSASTIYLQAEKMVWRPDPSKPQGLSLFASAQFATSGHPLVQSFYQVGAVLHGTFPGRPNDIAAIDFQANIFNPRASGYVNDEIAAQGLSGNVPNDEELLETNYSVELAPGIQIKPYAIYIFHPDQNLFDVTPNPKVTYAFETGLRLTIALNDVLGLPKFFRPD